MHPVRKSRFVQLETGARARYVVRPINAPVPETLIGFSGAVGREAIVKSNN